MLRKLRIIAQAVFFIGITLLFIGFGQDWWGWMAKLQFIPSCLAANAIAIVAISLLTLIFGRIYCSVICPLGVFQDIVIFLRKVLGIKKTFAFNRNRVWVRDAVVALVVLAIVFNLQQIIALIDPYSAYGRMIGSLVHPSWGTVAVIALATFVVIGVSAALWGRAWCGNVCPVGTILSIFGRHALLRPLIDKDKCVGCHGCSKKCKASCIDSFAGQIDYTRCIDCFDCIENCKAGAIHYGFAYSKKQKSSCDEKKSADTGRRAFLGGMAFLATSAALKAEDGKLAPVIDKQVPPRENRIVPPGARSTRDFYNHCTACQLCVQSCPNGVLRPSTDLEHLMQPQMGYEKGYCRPECTACSDVCPTGAILKLKEGEKLTISIGTARINPDLCVVNRDLVSCGNCARHCPVGAIRMVKKEGTELRVPTVNEDRCIGCGACENLCPSRPISAITVNGRQSHKTV